MIWHGVDIVKKAISFLNTQQIPVMVVDQPLFDIAPSKIQWAFLELLDKDDFFWSGRLHTEIALLGTMGYFPRWSRWPEAISEDIALTIASVTSYLRANDPLRTRYAHQITVEVYKNNPKKTREVKWPSRTGSPQLTKRNQLKVWFLIYMYKH